MQITKIINNNVVSSLDRDGKEVVIMGRGLAFQKKPGQDLDEGKIEKVFRLDNQDTMKRFQQLLENIPVEYLEVSNEIISYAKGVLQIQLNHNVYLTLTDHISFAMDRYHKNMMFPNALYREVRRFYATEFAVGMHALTLIEEKTGIRFPDDEAASIALHLVNAEYGQKVSDTMGMTAMLQGMLEILDRELHLEKNGSLYMDQLVSNCKFLAHRVLFLPETERRKDMMFQNFVQNHCQREYELAGKVKNYIKDQYGKHMTDEERLYLAVHIKNVADMLQDDHNKQEE